MQISYREVYCPAHFGNSYEVMWPNEMRTLLAEGKEWGFTAYGDWFDFADLKSPWNNPKNLYLLPQAIWERKIDNLRAADELGFAVDLVLTPNLVFLDQLTPALAADDSDPRYFGQLACPSKPEGREIILENHRRLFADLYAADVRLDSLCACPYDFGGCACEACQPWITTFGQLYLEIHELAKTFYPDIQARLAGWWWTADDHARFQAWADRVAPGRFISLAGHIPYGELGPAAGLALPEECAPHAFVHISYGDQAQPRDVYGSWGPVVAAERIPATLARLKEMGIDGYMAYSEGLVDDINKALLGGLSSGQFATASEVLAAYAERYFGAQGSEREAWAAWIAQWGKPWDVDTAAARREFDRLAAGARPGWRLAQLEGKLRIFEAHAAVLTMPEWDEARLAAADRFFAEREWLQRHVWGLGLVRSVLNGRYWPPSWQAEWEAVRKERRTRSARAMAQQ